MKVLLPVFLGGSLIGSFLLIGSAVGFVLWVPNAADWTGTFAIAGVLAFTLAMFSPMMVAHGRIFHLGHNLWKDILIDKLELQELIETTNPKVHFGALGAGIPSMLTLIPKWDAAILLEWPNGVAAFGAHGARYVAPADSMARSINRRIPSFPMRTAWCLETVDGSFHFASMDEPNLKVAANNMRASALRFAQPREARAQR